MAIRMTKAQRKATKNRAYAVYYKTYDGDTGVFTVEKDKRKCSGCVTDLGRSILNENSGNNINKIILVHCGLGTALNSKAFIDRLGDLGFEVAERVFEFSPRILLLSMEQFEEMAANIANADAEFTPVDSSAIDSVAYIFQYGEMRIRFVYGGVYRFYGVEPEVYFGLMNAESIGEYFNENVLGQYISSRMAA